VTVDKVCSIEDAVAAVPDGATVAIGGFGIKHSFPVSLLLALRAQGARDLTLVANSLGTGEYSAEALIDNGQVSRLIVSFSARAGMDSVAERLIAAGSIELELVPQGILVERLRAAGAGLAAFYSPTGVGTPLTVGKEQRSFDGRDYVLEQALPVDYALLRAHRADRHGNVEFRGASENFNPGFGKGAKVTIIEADEIVEPGEIDPQRVGLPSIFVTHVVPSTHRVVPDILDARRRPSTSRKTYLGRPGLSRAEMAARVAREIEDGSYVNLGAGMPSLVADELQDRHVLLHAENGVLGYGRPIETVDEVDPDLFDAAGAFVRARPGMSYFDSVTSFEIARSGKLDYVILGGYQVDAQANLANWSNPDQIGGGVGGAMDLVTRARTLIVMMQHCDPSGGPKLVETCTYPLTGLSCVDLVMTDLGLFRFVDGRWHVEETAPGFTAAEVLSLTDLPTAELTPAER
jgi:3-oxoacid CoA-transferase